MHLYCFYLFFFLPQGIRYTAYKAFLKIFLNLFPKFLTLFLYGYVAQLAEHRAFNLMVVGSNPAVPTNSPRITDKIKY